MFEIASGVSRYPNPVNIKSGKLFVGKDTFIGKDIVVNVAEEVVIGARCVIPDNTHFEGRRIVIGQDFYGYSWDWQRLDIGRGRKDEEDACLVVGNRCTFHSNKIDLARTVSIGNDVGLSPDVTIYTHHYWQSCLEGYPCKYAAVVIGDGVIVGYRSVILAGSYIGENSVIGAQSVVSNKLAPGWVFSGNPVKAIRAIRKPDALERRHQLAEIMYAYNRSLEYRDIQVGGVVVDYPMVQIRECLIDVEARKLSGEEDEFSDDLRECLFKHGIRVYTERRFKKLAKK